MKAGKSIRCLAALSCTVTMAAGGVLAQGEACLSSKMDVGYVSKYVWRGAVLNPDPSVQPSITFTLPSGLSYNLWMSANIDDGAAGGAQTAVEHDHTLNYPYKLGKYSMNTGYIYYAFPSTSFKATQEVYSSVCLGGKFSPTLSANYDFDEVNGAYLALASGYCCGIPFSTSRAALLNLSAKVGFGTGSYNKTTYAAPDKAALLDLVLGANTTFSLGGNFSLTPSLSYSTMIDKDVRDAMTEPDNLVGALTLSSTF